MSETPGPRVVVLMGVCGCGKSTVGRQLSKQLGWEFFDGDDFHPRANVEKMASGRPLDDEDRRPWLEALRELIDRRLDDETPSILACSALKRAYRRALGTERPEVLLVHLAGSRELLAERLASREGHFMPEHLLDSQLETLEAPSQGNPAEPGLCLDIVLSPEELCLRIAQEVFAQVA